MIEIRLLPGFYGRLLAALIMAVALLQGVYVAFAENATSSVVVANAAPTVSAVTINNGSAVTLTPYATTTIYINYTVTDNNGCGDVFFLGNVTSTAFRDGVGAFCSADNLNCYITSSVTSHNCPNATTTTTSADATSTVDLYYFADATDASSSYPNQRWSALAWARDQAGASSTATSTNVEVNTLNAIALSTSSISYGSVAAAANTGSTNQLDDVINGGNSSTTLRLSASATLTSGFNSISTSSQHYATSTFTYGGAEQALSDTATTVTGFLLLSPSSTANVSATTYWGLAVPAGTATGTYTGTNVFSALFQP